MYLNLSPRFVQFEVNLSTLVPNMTWNVFKLIFKKVPDFFLFDANLTFFEPNVSWKCSQIDLKIPWFAPFDANLTTLILNVRWNVFKLMFKKTYIYLSYLMLIWQIMGRNMSWNLLKLILKSPIWCHSRPLWSQTWHAFLLKQISGIMLIFFIVIFPGKTLCWSNSRLDVCIHKFAVVAVIRGINDAC